MIVFDYVEKPTEPGNYIHAFDGKYCLLNKLEKHPKNGRLYGHGGYIDQMPGKWYGPERDDDKPQSPTK